MAIFNSFLYVYRRVYTSLPKSRQDPSRHPQTARRPPSRATEVSASCRASATRTPWPVVSSWPWHRCPLANTRGRPGTWPNSCWNTLPRGRLGENCAEGKWIWIYFDVYTYYIYIFSVLICFHISWCTLIPGSWYVQLGKYDGTLRYIKMSYLLGNILKGIETTMVPMVRPMTTMGMTWINPGSPGFVAHRSRTVSNHI